MFSVYGKRPVLKGEKDFAPSQTDQKYHTLGEVLERLVKDGGSLPTDGNGVKESDSLDDIDPTKQRGFDIADASMIMSELQEQVVQNTLRTKKAVVTDDNKAKSEKPELADAGGNADGDGPKA